MPPPRTRTRTSKFKFHLEPTSKSRSPVAYRTQAKESWRVDLPMPCGGITLLRAKRSIDHDVIIGHLVPGCCQESPTEPIRGYTARWTQDSIFKGSQTSGRQRHQSTHQHHLFYSLRTFLISSSKTTNLFITPVETFFNKDGVHRKLFIALTQDHNLLTIA